MYQINDDLSIYVTRGDTVYLQITASNEETGENHRFQAGDVVRFKVYGRKDAEAVALQKDFPITEDTDTVNIVLDEQDTKIGEVISKPRDYWYEVELNPFTNPQTIIGYDEDGAKVFRLFPEGADIPEMPITPEDIPIVDIELDMTSHRPVENQAVSRAVVSLQAELDETNKSVSQTNDNVAGVAAEVAVERARVDVLVDHKGVTRPQALGYTEEVNPGTMAKLDGEISTDGAFATLNVYFREANLFYGGSGWEVFVIPTEYRPIDVGLIHSESGLDFYINYDLTKNRYLLDIRGQDGVTTAPYEAKGITMTYALDHHEVKDIRVGADGVTYASAGAAVREQANRAFRETAALNRNLMHISPIYGATEEELATMRAIRFIIPNGFDLSGYRLGIVQNNEEFPYTLRFVSDGGVAGLFEPVNPDDYSVLTWNGVVIGIDWGKIEEINKPYANSHLTLCSEDGPVEYALAKVAQCKAENDILKEAIVLCGVPGDEVKSTLSISGAWIRTGGTGIGTNSSELLAVSVYPVTAGTAYVLHGAARLAADNYPMAVFSEYGTQDEFKTEELIIPGGDVTTLKNYNVLYTPTLDGYVWVAEYDGYRVTVAEVAGYTTNSAGLKTPLKVQLFGDSVTDDYWGDKRTWATLLHDKLPECDLTVVNSAVGGSGIGHGHSGTARYADKEYNYVCDLLDDGTLEADNDVIIVCVGTNDWAAGRALGEWGDTTKSTFYGAVRYMVEQISKNTRAKLLVCTPLQRYNSTDEGRNTDKNGTPVNALGYTLRAYCDAFAETCEFYGIPCVDLHKTIGWNRYNIKKFCGDGLHPNNEGDEWIARIICNEIRYHCM